MYCRSIIFLIVCNRYRMQYFDQEPTSDDGLHIYDLHWNIRSLYVADKLEIRRKLLQSGANNWWFYYREIAFLLK
jgi:hypothetical protein